MILNFRTSYCYGYFLSEEKMRALDKEHFYMLLDSPWFQHVNNASASCDAFFGLELKTIDDGELYEIPLNYPYDHVELMNMLADYRAIFEQKPGIAHYYIINFVY